MIPADLTRTHVGHWVTLHRPHRPDVNGLLNAVKHAHAQTWLTVAVLIPDTHGLGGQFTTRGYPDDEVSDVTVGDVWVGPGETSTAKPERSRDYWADIVNSPRD